MELRSGAALLAGAAASCGAGPGAVDAGGEGEDGEGGDHTDYDDPADYYDHVMVDSGRWMDTEIAVGSIVAILIVAALVAVWISCRRRRKQVKVAAGDAAPLESVVSFSPPGPDEKARKLSRAVPASAAQSGVLHRPQELAVQTVVQPSTPGQSPQATPRQSPTDEASPSPWEPLYLLGLPGQVTRARRRSVSLRGEDDSDGDGSTRADSPAPGSPVPGDETPTRKRSVTFNAMVEEVQILPP